MRLILLFRRYGVALRLHLMSNRMSVVLLVTPSPSEPARSLPIAAEAVFRAHWLPMAARLSLTWLPRFQTGETVPLPYLPEVVTEFEAMAAEFFEAGELEFASRATAVSVELRRLIGGHPMAEVFIG